MDASLIFAINVKNQISLISKSKMQIIIFKLNIITFINSPNQSFKESYSHAMNMNRQNWPDTANLMEISSVWIVSKTTMIMIQKRISPNTLKIPLSKKFRKSSIKLFQKIKSKLNLFKNFKKSSIIKKRPTNRNSRISFKSFKKSKKLKKTFY